MTTSPRAEHEALRYAAALTEMDQVAAVRLAGGGAFDVLDRLVPADLYLRDGQMLHTLVLHSEGHPLADLYVCRDDQDFVLLAEGLSGRELIDLVKDQAPAGAELGLDDLGETHELISVNGPWAWEVLAEWIGPDIIGIPYLTFFHLDRRDLPDGRPGDPRPGIVFRGGKTGEFGYDLLLRREVAGRVHDRLIEVGEPLDLARASLAALDQCALENGFFSVRTGPFDGLTPIELQLQWRVSYGKDFLGSAALAGRRAEGPRQRLTTFTSPFALERGDPVFWEDRKVGVVWSAGHGPLLGRWVGGALLDTELAHPGIDAFTAGPGSIRTVSAPVINNRSLYVDPRRHSYRYRHDEIFPPVLPG